MSVRVVVADDQSLIRRGLRTIIDSDPALEVVGEAADGAEAVAATRRLEPDVLLLDIRMPGVDGLQALRELTSCARLRTKVVMLTTFDLDEYVYEALRAGAAGFLVKDIRDDDLLDAVRTVANGETLLAPSVTRRLIEAYTRRSPNTAPPAGADQLTAREFEVWRLMARGLTNNEIADQLVVSEATVKTHVARILAKLGARDRVRAVILAYDAGVV